MKTLPLLLLALIGCQSPIKKPFIIVGKDAVCATCYMTYRFTDAYGNTATFDDLPSKYNIGDTLKYNINA